MLDYRIHTFIKLCDLMNYRATAQALNMTQPAVTQHIHFLEKTYGCKLFQYADKKLSQTPEGKALEQYLRSASCNESHFMQTIHHPQVKRLSIGATKTIGDYVMKDMVKKLLHRSDIELTLLVENTTRLLERLNTSELDIALIEGYFDKHSYGHQLIRKEPLVGICAKHHPFAQREIQLEDMFQEKLIMREAGSGTRSILEHFLYLHNYSIDAFAAKASISSFPLIQSCVADNCGISLVYETIAKNDKNLATFTIKDTEIFHEFNYVYLKDTEGPELFSFFDLTEIASSETRA